MKVERVGFTGTQVGMTSDQLLEVRRLLAEYQPTFFIHGGCVGADEEADRIAFELGIHRVIRPQNHKPELSIPREIFERRVNKASRVTILPAKLPLARNLDIIRDSMRVIACPRLRKEELRSGTWMTIRNARRVLGKYNVDVVWP